MAVVKQSYVGPTTLAMALQNAGNAIFSEVIDNSTTQYDDLAIFIRFTSGALGTDREANYISVYLAGSPDNVNWDYPAPGAAGVLAGHVSGTSMKRLGVIRPGIALTAFGLCIPSIADYCDGRIPRYWQLCLAYEESYAAQSTTAADHLVQWTGLQTVVA